VRALRGEDTLGRRKETAPPPPRCMGVEVETSLSHPSLIPFIEHRGVEVVYDVGANVGQFGRALRLFGYKGLIVSFEPASSNYALLEKVAAADGNWDCFHCALGSKSGKAQINGPQDSQSSSLGMLSGRAESNESNWIDQSQETVDLYTLDWIVGTMRLFVHYPAIIEIGVRGFEREVLKGARRTLTKTAGVLMKSPTGEGSRTFSEAMQYLEGLGFSPCQIGPTDPDQTDRMAVMAVDCLFQPKSAAIH
jgi:FkbM family methyltransferase